MRLSVWTLIRRGLSAHRGVSLLLVVVIAVGAFLGAAAPRWFGGHLDETLHRVVSTAGQRADLSARAEVDPLLTRLNGEIPALEARTGADLGELLGAGRWSASTSTSQLLGQNGTLVDDGKLPRRLSIRVPDDLTSRVELVDGALPAAVESVPIPPGLADMPIPHDGTMTVVDVVTTPAVAEELRIAVGDVVVFENRGSQASAIDPDAFRVPTAGRLTGLVEAVDPDDPLWSDALTALAPDMGERGGDTRTTTATLLTDPALLDPWAAGKALLTAEWHVQLDAGRLRSDTVDDVSSDLNRLVAGGEWSSGLTDILAGYSERRAAAEGVVAFGVVSLGALCVALVLLAVRLLADRRIEQVVLARARGATDRALFRLFAADAAMVGVPAAAVGVAAAWLIVPGRSGGLSLLLPGALVLGAVLALPLVAIGLARRTASRRSSRRVVAEVGVVALAALGLWLVSVRSAGAGVDLVVSLVPILVATAAALLIFRLVPVVVAALLPVVRRAPGATAFLALSRTARAPGHALLPVVAMLVAIGVAAFGGTVESSVERAREVSSWDQVGGEARASSALIRVDPETVATVPGATAAAVGHIIVSQRPVNLDTGRQAGVDILAVDAPNWAKVTAAAPEPVTPVDDLLSETPSGEIPAVLQGGIDGIAVGDRLEVTVTGTPVTVEVIDQVVTVPGAPSGSTLVMPLAPLADVPLGPTEVAYLGGDVTAEDVATTLGIATEDVLARSATVTSIADDPVLRTVVDAFALITIIAAALAAVAAVLGLAVGERSRSFGLSILRTLGTTTRQSAILTAADVVPTAVMATVVGVGTGIGVGVVATGAMDLQALSGAVSGESAIVADLPGAVTAASIVLAVVMLAVVVAVVTNRRASLGSALRAGEQT